MLGIIVPLRRQPEFDRHAHLAALLQRLQQQHGPSAPCVVVVVEEDTPSPYRFNRGALLNVGYRLAPALTSVIFHDVDLLPCPVLCAEYARPILRGTVRHLGMRWTRYASNPQYLGGVVGLHPDDLERLDGFPATFWGWGGEDDALAVRCQRAGLRIERPSTGSYDDQEQLSLEQKLGLLRRTRAKCSDKWEQLAAEREGHRRPGLAHVRFERLHTHVETLAPGLQLQHHTVRFKTPFGDVDGASAYCPPARQPGT